MELIYPTTDYKQSYLEAIEESKGETGDTVLKKPVIGQDFAEFVVFTKEEAQGLHLPEGWIPATELWLIDRNEFIGTVNIRHRLTEHLLKIGGHIGYWIRPSKDMERKY